MELSIKMEAEEWLDLCGLLKDCLEIATPNMGVDPLAYSSIARLNNEIFNQVAKKLPLDELDRIKQKRKFEHKQ